MIFVSEDTIIIITIMTLLQCYYYYYYYLYYHYYHHLSSLFLTVYRLSYKFQCEINQIREYCTVAVTTAPFNSLMFTVIWLYLQESNIMLRL